MGVALDVVVRRYIDFLILLIPTRLVSVLFLQQHPYFFYIFFSFFLFFFRSFFVNFFFF